VKPTFWERSQRTPPILVRLLARHPNGPPLTEEEISQASGLPVHEIFCIGQSTDWSGIDLPKMRRFLVACRIDFENFTQMKRVDSYLRMKPTWKYLRMSPIWKTFYEPLMIRYRKSIRP